LTIRAAVIGTRGVGTVHVAALRKLPGVEVWAVAGSSETTARRAAERLSVPRAYAGYARVVAAPEVDVVHVCTPNDTHLEIAEAALRHRKHVVCEKPLATDAADGERLLAAASNAGATAALCYNYRFLPLVAVLRNAIRAGEIGRVHGVRGTYLQNWMLPPAVRGWRDEPARSGSSRVLGDIGTHLMDLVEVITGSQIAQVAADFGGLTSDLEDRANVLLRLEDETHGVLSVSQVSAAHTNRLGIAVDGERGSAMWSFDGQESLHLTKNGDTSAIRFNEHAPATSFSRRWTSSQAFDSGLSALLSTTYRAIRTPSGGPTGDAVTETPPATFTEGLRHLRVIEAALRSFAQGPFETVPACHPSVAESASSLTP
jgi:predicted dehydrogenase